MDFIKEHKQLLGGFACGLAATVVITHFWIPPWCQKEKARDKSALPEVVGYRTVHKNDVPNPNHTYKLIYFNVKALAEPSRLIFAAAGNTDYEDFRYPMDVKNNFARPEFDADAAAGKFRHTMGQVPVLEVDGKLSFGQSKAIERYLARQFGFWGESEAEGALVDSVCEHIRDLKDEFKKIAGPRAEEKQKAIEVPIFLEKELPGWLKGIEDSLSGANGYSVGCGTTLADILLFHLFLDILPLEALTALQLRPKLAAINARMSGDSRIREWIRKRPITPF
jgi:glutathione S-transferase